MSEVVTRAERHVRRESVMEPGLGYCRECKQTWPCLYVAGQRDERERCRAAVLDHFKVAPLAAEPILRRIG